MGARNTVNGDQGQTAPRPVLVISLLIHEDAIWFREWITLTHAAVDMEHCIVASVPPDRYDQYQVVLPNITGCVLFSPPAVKFPWGLDLLRGHVANVKHAHTHFPHFTHAVLAASNNMWITRLTHSWPGFSIPVKGQCECGCRPPAEVLILWLGFSGLIPRTRRPEIDSPRVWSFSDIKVSIVPYQDPVLLLR